MKSNYHINPKEYSIQYLEENLFSRELIPSREPLKEDMQTKFSLLRNVGIQSLDDLLRRLKNKKALEETAAESGISVEYLTLLRREANSYLPNPVPLNKFSGILDDNLFNLKEQGINNSRHMYEKAGSDSDRKQLSEITGITMDVLEELVGLSDLVRAYGVGPVFARVLYDTGIHSIRELVKFSPEEIIQLYEDKFHQKADFSLRDMNFSLDIAKSLKLGVDI